MANRYLKFKENFSNYDDCIDPGVKLPEINITLEQKKELKCKPNCSNLDYLKALCWKGVRDKGVDKLKNKQDYYDRAKTELEILDKLGFVDYILLNWDILNYCHENDIPTGPGRGSAAGSLVLFLIRVTNIDPVKYDLFFERFVSESRAKKIEKNGVTYLDGSLLADIDNDISYERRKDVISYIENRFPGRTAKILTLNTLSGKLCIKECGKIVKELSEQDVNLVSSYIPKRFGEVAPLRDAYNESQKFKEWVDSNEKIFKIAKKIEGLNKNTGVHPSGIAICHQDISRACPIQKTNDGAFVTGYDMNWVAELMVKFDILGLRTLTVIHDTCKQLNISPESIDLNSKAIFKPLKNLENPHGLFQIEADTNFRVCRKIKPSSLEELSAVVAIARPGALEFMDNYSDYIRTGDFQSVHPFFDEVLNYTGGIPLYQEQLMKMAVKVGFTLDEAEQLRRIVGKKKVKEMPQWKSKISEKIREKNLDEEIGEVLWKVAEDSANYSFNKSHSISYATLAAWTVYLKFKYPKQFFLSLLKMTEYEPSPQEEISKVSRELSFFNIQLLQPDLIRSNMEFSIEKDNIRFGLNSIKGVSNKSLANINSFIKENENTSNKFELFLCAKECGINIGILCGLIQAGALHTENKSRARTVLEAQAFNILTDREKRLFTQIGSDFDYDILTAVSTCISKNLLGDNGKPIMSEKRFQTFKTKLSPYKEIYEKNKSYEQFANWYFETKLLGYSYSTTLQKVFSTDKNRFYNTYEHSTFQKGERVKMVCVVEDVLSGVSRNGNKYIKLSLHDEIGSVQAMIGDFRTPNLTKYKDSGGVTPKKDNIIVIVGEKSDDIIFVDRMSIMDDKIYMKLSDLK